MEAKNVRSWNFLGDTQNLIRPDREFNPRLGYELAFGKN